MNPILQNLRPQTNNALSQLANLKQLITGNSPQAVYSMLMQSNPQFRQFINANQGKPPEQIAQENGIDLNQVMSLFR